MGVGAVLGRLLVGDCALECEVCTALRGHVFAEVWVGILVFLTKIIKEDKERHKEMKIHGNN